MGGRGKRLLDVVAAAALLTLLSPFLLFLALLVRYSSPGPIFYRQMRLGQAGRAFAMLKFRTMHVNAEATTGAVWATKNDPRATTVGRWLRRWSLDEIPQLWNVLVGEMSLVGPRPERPPFVARFGRELPGYWRRHEALPGMTGLAQIRGWRGQTSLAERLACDLEYIEGWRLWKDLRILLLTPLRIRAD